MEFINREKDLRALEGFCNKDKTAQMVIIYGKRRVGKTELIKQFIKNKHADYFIARKISEKDNLFALGVTLGRYFDDALLQEKGFDKWDQLFLYLKNKLSAEKQKEHFVLAIDEFPYLTEANKGISSIFQAGWDEHLKDLPIYLILCGSSIAMMESETLAYKAPLYGRRTGQLLLKPLQFSEFRKFLPDKTFKESMDYYSISGGMPAYILRLVNHANLDSAIKEEIFSPEAMLYQEVEFILKEELREPRNYFSILKAIAYNCTRVSEIINQTGMEKSALHNYLFVLEDLHLIKKEVPVTEKKPQISRKGRYYLEDQFVKFWFNYVFPFMSELELDNKSAAFKKFKDTFSGIVAQNYEKVAVELLWQNQNNIFSFHKAGRWWDKNEEIDVVAINEETSEILFGEAKYSDKPVGVNIYEDLKRKSEKVDWGINRREYFCLFSKSGFTPQIIDMAKKEKIFLIKEDKLINN